MLKANACTKMLSCINKTYTIENIAYGDKNDGKL
jgi:hypothetical protein